MVTLELAGGTEEEVQGERGDVDEDVGQVEADSWLRPL